MKIDMVGTRRVGCERIARIAPQAGYEKGSHLWLLDICFGKEELETVNCV